MSVELILSAECYLWDFDGCFADTEKLHFLAYREAFAKVGHTLSESDYYPSFTHLGDGTGREIAQHRIAVAEDEIIRSKAEAYARLIRQGPVACFAETLPIIRHMRARGAKVAIASNSSQEEIRVVLSSAGFPSAELDLIVGKQPDLRKKPAPDIFLHALAQLGCSPERALVLEDSNRGLQAAAAAGCAALWMRTRYNEGLETSQPHVQSLTHAQLLKFFEAVGQ